MLGTQVRQKDGVFYFVSYPAEDLLRKVRFISRFYSDDERIAAEEIAPEDEVGRFIGKVERTDGAFQRELSRQKVGAIENFYETATSQPPIPGTVLLFTNETLEFDPVGSFENVGNIQEPGDKYLIIDGQHRLAALHFYAKHHPEEARTIHVPCIIFDGRSEDFATEMFVIINSTPTRINKSHLIDLYEKVSWSAPDKKLAARVVQKLYEESDSPLRYRINRLGGRSRQEKWILQAELYNEIHRWVQGEWAQWESVRTSAAAEDVYETVRDFLKASERVWGDAWGNGGFVVTKPVTLKAMLRVGAELAHEDAGGARDRVARWAARLEPWTKIQRDFRTEGFYERFPARGQVERVTRIARELARHVGLTLGASKSAAKRQAKAEIAVAAE